MSGLAVVGWLTLVVAVLPVVWLVRSALPRGAKDWDVDAQGPVLVSVDGRTLTLSGVPDPRWSAGDCFSGLGAEVKTTERGADVAVWFHLHFVPRQPGDPAGSCAQFTGIDVSLDRPLGARLVTDHHGRPLRIVREADLPRPRRAGLVADRSFLCVASQGNVYPYQCDGAAGLVRGYEDHTAQDTWFLYQAIDARAPTPHPSGKPTELARATVNGVPVGCHLVEGGGVEVDWLGARPAQWLILATPEYAAGWSNEHKCAAGFDAARTVR